MTKVEIIVELQIDDSNKAIDEILAEMDYDFSYISVNEGIEKQLEEVELIKNSEILKRIN